MIMNPPTGEEYKKMRLDFQNYNNMYRHVAGIKNLLLIDHQKNWEVLLNQGLDEFLKYVPDGIHPSSLGCKEIITPHILNSLGLDSGE